MSNIRINFKKRDSTTVQLEGFTEGNVDGINIQATKDKKFYASGKFDGAWNSSVGLATNDDIPTRYGGTGIEIPAGKSCKISVITNGIFAALLFVQGTTGSGFGTFMIQGYGVDGGTSRYHVNSLNTSGTQSGITCTVGDGAYFMVKNDTSNKVKMVFEEFFNYSAFTNQVL